MGFLVDVQQAAETLASSAGSRLGNSSCGVIVGSANVRALRLGAQSPEQSARLTLAHVERLAKEAMPKSRDYFAELYVAGILGDCGWSIYFPKRDVGFDFIITKQVGSRVMMRPVQVKGKYPEEEKAEKKIYGYIGQLSQTHLEMVLAIPFFPTDRLGVAPVCTAYVPFWRISTQASRGYACQPVVWRDALPTPRETYRRFFDFDGIRAMQEPDWSTRPKTDEENI